MALPGQIRYYLKVTHFDFYTLDEFNGLCYTEEKLVAHSVSRKVNITSWSSDHPSEFTTKFSSLFYDSCYIK